MALGVSPSMALALAGFCFSLIFIAFVCSRLACALLRRHRRRARARSTAALPRYAYADDYTFAAVHVLVHHPAASAGGLGPDAVAALPTQTFANCRPRGSGASDADSQCVICLAEYEEGDVLRILPHCGHDFHMACIDLWLEQNSTCPVCRVSLLDNPDSEHTAPLPLPSVVVISPPSSPEPSGSDPCRCLFAGTGHASRTLEAPRQEPDLENQVASRSSVDGGANSNSVPLSEVNPTPENNSQTRKQQIGPCK